jgi:acyl-CoA dehydrogenase
MAAQVALRSACEALSAEGGSRSSLAFDVAVAKVCAGEAATLATSVAHQVHGAIGFTHEHTLHFATRRLWSWRDEFGSDAQWAEVLGQAAIAAGSSGFWKGLTVRKM